MQRLRIALALVLVAALFGGGMVVGRVTGKPAPAAEAEKPDAPEAKPQVRLGKVTRATLDTRVVCFGTAVARPENDRILTARIAAVISAVHFRKGDRVKAGDVILTLDPRSLAAARRKAEGAVAEAEAELAKARSGGLATELAGFKVALAQAKADVLQSQRLVARQRELSHGGLVSARQLEEAEAGAEIANLRAEAATLQVERAEHGVQHEEIARLEARSAQARADLETAQLQESFAEVRAEIDGTLAELDAVPGQSVDAVTPLGRLVGVGVLDALLSVPGEWTDQVKLGADVRILVGAVEVGHATLEAISGAVSADGTRALRATLKAASHLVPGTPVTGEIATAQLETLAVPREAVVQDNDRTVIFVLRQAPDPDEPKEPIEVARKIQVKVLVRDGPLVGIEGDVPEGDKVVVEGAYNLPDGTEVEPLE